jgi:predicted nucleotidyltransferase
MRFIARRERLKLTLKSAKQAVPHAKRISHHRTSDSSGHIGVETTVIFGSTAREKRLYTEPDSEVQNG